MRPHIQTNRETDLNSVWKENLYLSNRCLVIWSSSFSKLPFIYKSCLSQSNQKLMVFISADKIYPNRYSGLIAHPRQLIHSPWQFFNLSLSLFSVFFVCNFVSFFLKVLLVLIIKWHSASVCALFFLLCSIFISIFVFLCSSPDKKILWRKWLFPKYTFSF